MTIPNLITILRILLAPAFAIYLINDHLTSALIVFVIAGVSDGVDGFVARVFNQKSKLGAYLDPLADKILLVTAYVILASRGHLPPWLTVIVISRDILILLGVLILSITRSEFTIRPSVLSKLTTCLQLVTVFVALTRGHLALLSQLDDYLYWITAALTAASGLHYMRTWFRFVGGGVLGNSTGKEQTPRRKIGKGDDTA